MHISLDLFSFLGGVVPAYNKRMQRARDPDKCVLCWPHRRVADARRQAATDVALSSQPENLAARNLGFLRRRACGEPLPVLIA